jgi:hypothetical protein
MDDDDERTVQGVEHFFLLLFFFNFFWGFYCFDTMMEMTAASPTTGQEAQRSAVVGGIAAIASVTLLFVCADPSHPGVDVHRRLPRR